MNLPKQKFYQKKENICSVIVVYKTKINLFINILKGHKQNFTKIIIINNSPDINFSIFQSKQVTIINNSKNLGLSNALNIGIKEAMRESFDMVALFDQDTEISEKFTINMVKYINTYESLKKTALFSPVYYNSITDAYGSIINFKPFRLSRSEPNKHIFSLNPHYVITSGSFIPTYVFDDVGLMREELFIDFIDIDWCLRARSKGYEIVSFPQLEITHHLGDSSFCFLGTNYPIHSPLRMYYYFRNSIFLYGLSETEWNWRFVDASRNLFRFFFYMLFIKNRPKYFKYIMRGYYHGLIKKMGKLDE